MYAGEGPGSRLDRRSTRSGLGPSPANVRTEPGMSANRSWTGKHIGDLEPGNSILAPTHAVTDGSCHCLRVTGSAWIEVTQALDQSPYPVTVLPATPGRAQQCLAELGITTRSWLGAVVAHSGGLLVDHGWLRVLGSGTDELADVLVDADPAAGGLIIALDVLGGQFAWVPARPGVPPTVHYFGPDTLAWLDLEQGYADWLNAVLAGALTQFYVDLRWPGWPDEVAALSLTQGIHTWPPPSTREGKDLSLAGRRAIPMSELVGFHHSMAEQLEGIDGQFVVRFEPPEDS